MENELQIISLNATSASDSPAETALALIRNCDITILIGAAQIPELISGEKTLAAATIEDSSVIAAIRASRAKKVGILASNPLLAAPVDATDLPRQISRLQAHEIRRFIPSTCALKHALPDCVVYTQALDAQGLALTTASICAGLRTQAFMASSDGIGAALLERALRARPKARGDIAETLTRKVASSPVTSTDPAVVTSTHILHDAYPIIITIDGAHYPSVIHYIAHVRAEFDRVPLPAKFPSGISPSKCLHLTLPDSGWPAETSRAWAIARKKAFIKGTEHKLAQHAQAREALLSTGNSPLIYCSRDRKLGIGFVEPPPGDTKSWPGANEGGAFLKQARKALMRANNHDGDHTDDDFTQEDLDRLAGITPMRTTRDVSRAFSPRY